MIRVRRALLSAHDKTGLADLARALTESGAELLSSGGTARHLREAGLKVTDVSEVTGFPECFGGRVKTLHPLVHGGLLLRRGHPGDESEAESLGVRPIDLVAVNLYPFERTVARENVTRAEAIEQVDIGGPTLLRAAAKNHESVVVLVDPADHARVLDELREHGGVSRATAAALAVKAFDTTSRYDGAIAAWLADHPREGDDA